MNHPYHNYVSEISRLFREGQELPLGDLPPPAKSEPAPDARKVLIFSPHPDDEVIIGGLALRLMRESGMRVINVAVTQGSNRDRQQARLEELKNCCEHIGFDLVQTAGNGLERVNLRAREEDPGAWIAAVQTIEEILLEHRPDIVFLPHDTDQNSTHIGTHYLLIDAMQRLPRALAFYTVETEFWSPMASPNLAVELTDGDLADLIAALSFHVGEVERNPYHLRLPAWMMDNVRRGGELVGSQGGGVPDFMFATLYRLRRWEQGRFRQVLERGRFLGAAEKAGVLFPSD